MVLLVLLAVAVWCGICLLYVGLLVREALRGGRLDATLLRLRLRWRPSTPRHHRLERRIVWRVLAGGMPDPARRVVWLPDDIEVLVAPRDLLALGPAAERIRRRVHRRLQSLERTRECRFRAPPIVTIVDDPGCRPGHPELRIGFGEATEAETVATAGRNGSRPPRPGGAVRARRAFLRPLWPPGPPQRLRAGRHFRIGRLPSCDLVVRQPTVSRTHAVMYERNGAWYVADDGSTNGTFVNRLRIDRPVRLAEADEIRLGASVVLRFERYP
jgi:hypothetical protein